MSHVVPFSFNPGRRLAIDLVADFTCPWSWLGMVQMQRALGSLQGDVQTEIRWHPFRMAAEANSVAAPGGDFRSYLTRRLPAGVPLELAQQSLTGTARELGLQFHFDRMRALPDTTEAHRLTVLAAREGLQAQMAAAVFRAYFAELRDIGSREVLVALTREVGLSSDLLAQFEATRDGIDALEQSEQRLRGFGVNVVPNLLFNGRVLVPGAVNVNTYVLALDQALFPESEPSVPRRLH